MKATVSLKEIYQIAYREHRDPFQILGPHIITDKNGRKKVVIRCFLPDVQKASICAEDGKQYPMQKLHDEGFFEGVCEDRTEVFRYQIEVVRAGEKTRFYDSYSFPPGLTNFDLYLMQEGSHYRTYEKLGAHIISMNGIKGVYFAVWAPNAKSMSVIGSFNRWNPRYHVMRTLGSSGVWEIFIPGIGAGELYKYRITTLDNYAIDKADPHGFYAELSPNNASVVYELDDYSWQDQKWLEERAQRNLPSSPMSIYEVHLGSWRRKQDNSFFSYRELAPMLVEYVLNMGYTHIELLPVLEHPFYGSWGYQVIGHYAPTSRYGEPKDFMYFVDYCHQHGIGVLLDWVPAHFPKDAHGLGMFDGTHLYEHSHPLQREHLDWGTFIYNYGRNEVSNYLLSNALFWLEKYHIDGLRVDAVASMLYLDYSKHHGQWIPNKFGGRENIEAIAFLQKLNTVVRQQHPGCIVVAEESTSWPGVTRPIETKGLGFHYKWNMGWMNDILKYMACDPIHRKYEHNTLAFSIWYCFDENFILPLSHDEVVHLKKSMIDKMHGDVWQKFANLRLLYGFMFAHPGKKMLFMGDDFGQWSEWNHERALDWGLLAHQPHKKLQDYVRDLNKLYRNSPCLSVQDNSGEGFEWIDYHDADNSVIAFLRKSDKQQLMFTFNFTPVPRYQYKLGVSCGGFYKEIFNSDANEYWGSGTGNLGGIEATPEPRHGKSFTLQLALPPLSMVVFEPVAAIPDQQSPIVVEQPPAVIEQQKKELQDPPKNSKKAKKARKKRGK